MSNHHKALYRELQENEEESPMQISKNRFVIGLIIIYFELGVNITITIVIVYT